MKHPFWLVNSVLLILFFIVGGLLFFLPSSLQRPVDFLPEKESKLPKIELPKIDLARIYTNDLFGTYKEVAIRPSEPEKEKTLPQPPVLQPAKVTPKPAPSFISPLEITLRGIMISDDEKTNTAILEDNKTKQAKNYYIGETVQDAQLIRISRNKIMLVRSNGQQETLYLNKYDAEINQLLAHGQDWTTVVKKIDVTEYHLDPSPFIERIHNLGQLIDALNLTTVYQKGESVGCRVGVLAKNSLGEALGLKTGDIITMVNDVPTTTTDKRYEAYKLITSLTYNDVITVQLNRKSIPVTMTYALKNLREEQKLQEAASPKEQQPYDVNDEKLKVLERKYRFAPSAQELKEYDKQTMNSQRQGKRKHDILIQPITPDVQIGTS